MDPSSDYLFYKDDYFELKFFCSIYSLLNLNKKKKDAIHGKVQINWPVNLNLMSLLSATSMEKTRQIIR
jgi:hypothetical protein